MKFSAGPSNGAEENSTAYDTVDELLEYKVGGNRLRDVITHITVLDRTL